MNEYFFRWAYEQTQSKKTNITAVITRQLREMPTWSAVSDLHVPYSREYRELDLAKGDSARCYNFVSVSLYAIALQQIFSIVGRENV